MRCLSAPVPITRSTPPPAPSTPSDNDTAGGVNAAVNDGDDGDDRVGDECEDDDDDDLGVDPASALVVAGVGSGVPGWQGEGGGGLARATILAVCTAGSGASRYSRCTALRSSKSDSSWAKGGGGRGGDGGSETRKKI